MRRLGRIAQQYPFAVSVGVATAKTGGADFVVQRYVENKKSIDWSRTISFSVFGFVFLGVVQWFIYVPGYRLVFKEMDKFCQQTIKQKLRNKAGLKDLAGYVHHYLRASLSLSIARLNNNNTITTVKSSSLNSWHNH